MAGDMSEVLDWGYARSNFPANYTYRPIHLKKQIAGDRNTPRSVQMTRKGTHMQYQETDATYGK